MDDATPERWLPVPGWEGLYEASDHGQVRSVEHVLLVRNRWGAFERSYGGLLLKPHLNLGGYPIVSLSHPSTADRPARSVTKKVANLVALAFLGPKPFPGAEVCHNDGDKMNSRLSNLRYDTASANERDKVAHGTHHHASKTHCPQGHPYDEENTYVNPSTGGRQCRTCIRIRQEAKKKPPVLREPVPHGTTVRYTYGCRCDECRAAKSADGKEYRRRRKEAA